MHPSRRSLVLGAAAILASERIARADEKGRVHHIAIQVDENDEAKMTLALNNIANTVRYYSEKGEETEVELVAYGPGLHMLREDTSPVKARLKSIKESLTNVTFTACEVTLHGMEKAEGKSIPIVPQAGLTPSGVVRLTDLQEKGWSYIKP